jgi:hypothetical protein
MMIFCEIRQSKGLESFVKFMSKNSISGKFFSFTLDKGTYIVALIPGSCPC